MMIEDTMFDNDCYALFIEQGSGKMAINALNALPTHREESQRTQGVGSVGWIPCSERLPRLGFDVLTYRPTMGMKMLVDKYDGFYDDDDEWHEEWVYGKDRVVAWMPLPEQWRPRND